MALGIALRFTNELNGPWTSLSRHEAAIADAASRHLASVVRASPCPWLMPAAAAAIRIAQVK